ncbi:pilus assembly protein [Shewanella sp. 10N.286.48.A6]|uniref:pilus assembly protein n=1 Tax=Shewanella sp. 10N.286.48.A6 TaxID=1880833 RepID=UPI000C821181|nr:PilC/PilY family type IV pilus protein [Shewanella sp. 10N.286.48.A6]PMI02896.1 hypothetical protein BCU55_04805 [Shewanella sp. 10N.286.48.A6]
MITKITTIALGFIGLGLIANSFADDTELYVLESSARSNDNPQVLLIMDTSGSMGDNSFTAPRFHEQSTISNSTKLYFSNDGAVVPEASSNQYFLSGLNGCASSKAFLNEYGLYTGYFREYQESTWSKFPLTDGSSIATVDCYEDIYEQDTSNAGGVSGYPVDGLASPYDSDIEKAKLTEFGLGDPIHIYTQEYVTWFHNASKPNGKSNGDSYTRMDVAKRILEELIVSTPGIDFGLAIFNKNNSTSRDGGRIISGMKEASVNNKNSIITSIDDSDSINGNYTPLCETLFEAYSYLYGKPVKFGHKTNGSTSNPSYDENIESDGNYISPFEGKDCQSSASIIYVTDGIPNNDVSADTAIGLLPGIDLTLGVDVVWSGNTTTNLLAPLANWMYKNDVNPNAPLDQTVSTYTIGFSSGADDAETLLKKTAENAGGVYYKANSAEALKASLLQAVTAIQGTDSSFTSPSVVLDKTQTGDAAYFAMFLPDKGPRWSGNLKKFKVTADGNVVDKDGNDAFDSNGAIAEEACSFWTSTAECNSTSYKGYHVSDGGVAAVMRSAYSSSISSRNVLLNNGSSGDLISFTPSNAKLNGFLSTDAKLASYMGVDESDISDSFDWAKGINVDNEDNDDDSSTAPLYLRQDIMGDPLHSRPLVINYGNESSPDNRIIMGTNHGFLHMFKDEVSGDTSSVSESWAFMPVELLKNIKGLRDNPQTGVHSIYGMDGSPVAYIERDSSDKVSKAWLYVGMRRGGSSYYALDITDPDAPSLKWISQTSDFSVQGESWSEPVITKVPDWPAGATTSADANPVLIIGAGYNPTTKDGSSVGSSDTTGVGVYIIDADKGTKVHSFGLAGSDTSMPGLSDSIPNKVAILDSNNDQLTDRIYATDTGANVWRLDLPGLSTDSSNPWSAFKFASLGGGTTTTDIRFFSEPVVAQTTFSNVAEHTHTEGGTTTTTMTYQSIPYDAVVIGSGHRPHPLDKQRADKFFTLQDRNIVTKSYSSAAGNTTPDALDITDLYNVTSESPASDTELITFGSKRGWYYNFSDEGEKSLSAATIVSGRVFFTSYVPETGASENACLVPGQGRLYGFDLHKGARTYSHSEDYFVMGEQVPDTPTLVVPHNGDSDSYMYLIGIGDAANDMIKNDVLGDDGCAEGDDKCIGGGLGVNRIYYHQHEN